MNRCAHSIRERSHTIRNVLQESDALVGRNSNKQYNMLIARKNNSLGLAKE